MMTCWICELPLEFDGISISLNGMTSMSISVGILRRLGQAICTLPTVYWYGTNQLGKRWVS